MQKKICGLDAHKDTIFCSIYDGKKHSEVKEFKTLAPSISSMGEYLHFPEICEISAMIIIAESGADMKAFENSGKFTGWIGLCPKSDESARKYKSTATTKGNKYLRTILVQVAWAASRTKDSYYKEKLNQLSMRKPRKKALIAIDRKLATVIWNILYYQVPFDANKAKLYDPVKLKAKLEYYKKEQARLELLLR